MPPSPVDVRAFAASFVPLWQGDRGGHPDFVRFGAYAASDAEGRLVDHAGNPQLVAFLRSSAKPFQAVAFLRRGLDRELGLGDADVACACASHDAEDRHVEAARRILAAGGNREDDLRCGTHEPSRELSLKIQRGEAKLGPIHNNCSGKHSAMLATCRREGWPTASYTERDHPLQQENLATLAAFAGLPAGDIAVGIDNCTVPTFGLPLAGAARAFARLLDPAGLPDDLASAGRRAAAAMMAHPGMVGGHHRVDTDLMELTKGRVVIKTGANGYHAAAGRPAAGGPAIGIAVKLSAAETEVQKAPVVLTCLARVGLITQEEAAAMIERHPGGGQIQGRSQRSCRDQEVGKTGPA